MRYAFIFAMAFSFVLGACESQPGNVDVDPTGTTYDTTGVGDDTPGSDERRPDAEDGNDGTASLGVPLQTLLEGAESRHPGTQQLSILDRLNEPESISIETQTNRHIPGQTDTLRTLHYDNADITIYQVSGGKELMKSVTVSGGSLESPEGIRIGMTSEEVENVLGQPAERENGAYVYEEDAPMPTRFHVHIHSGDVSRMEWRFPID